MSLQREDVKLSVIQLSNEGYSERDIGSALDLPKSTVGDFLRKDTYTVWWCEYDNRSETTSSNSVDVRLPVNIGEQAYLDSLSTPTFVSIATSFKQKHEATHFVIPDTQCKEGIDMSYLSWIGRYIVDRKPDVIIHLGDHADMPSLSSYDKGKKKAEGKRVYKDIEAAILGMNILLKPIQDLQLQELEEFGEIRYKPKMVLCLGNHEYRIQRHVEANAELDGFLSYDNLKYKEMGWEVFDFLEPTIVNGVTYCHFMANPMSGKPYGGMASNILKHVGESFTVGHKQTLDVATRFLPASGRQQWAIVAGACYTHEEDYKGYQGNHHWRGVIVKHNVKDGSYNPMFVDLDFLKRRFGSV
jgi:hypothetical protein